MKRILVALPVQEYVEVETFKSIWDLEVPEGYELDLRIEMSDNISQVRNLIAEWAKRYDYLFSVDSDIVLPKNTLTNFLAADKPIISGLYIQRIQNTHTLEVYMDTPNGGTTNIPYELIRNKGIVEIAGCGFGCVLIKSEVFRKIPYPHFEYHVALDHKNTVSEDTDFCIKARKAGYTIWADSSIICDHIGNYTYMVETPEKKSHRDLSNMDLLPKKHLEYIKNMNINPKVIYDIGSSVLHWSKKAREIWPNAQFYLFEAMDTVYEIYEDNKFFNYHLGVLSDSDGRVVDFYENKLFPGGNSYYRENYNLNSESLKYFNEQTKFKKITTTIDSIIKLKNWPKPDLVKMDIQGAELDVLKGGINTFKGCKDFILELQNVEYNIGAPMRETVIDYMLQNNYELISNFISTGVDGDYHFRLKE
jgi:FkbM family methyltransferase